MILLRSVSFYLAILGILLAIIYSNISGRPPPPPVVVQEPAVSPFPNYIAASGIVEAVDKNIEVGSPEEGIIERLWFKVGDSVKEGDPLFQLDTRTLEAKLLVERADVETAKATLEKQIDLLERVKAVTDPRSISWEDFKNRENEVKIARARLKAAEAEVLETERLIDRLTVRAPMNGTLLQENIRVGEYVMKGKPALILGNLEHLQVRVNIDEQNASRFKKNSPAVAFPKNNTSMMFPLQFVRIEPYVIPKQSLTGAPEERVDTRVLQVIYAFDSKNYSMYVGQQVDVFIKD
jgi:RND family efflux transporter MFP subunit